MNRGYKSSIREIFDEIDVLKFCRLSDYPTNKLLYQGRIKSDL